MSSDWIPRECGLECVCGIREMLSWALVRKSDAMCMRNGCVELLALV